MSWDIAAVWGTKKRTATRAALRIAVEHFLTKQGQRRVLGSACFDMDQMLTHLGGWFSRTPSAPFLAVGAQPPRETS